MLPFITIAFISLGVAGVLCVAAALIGYNNAGYHKKDGCPDDEFVGLATFVGIVAIIVGTITSLTLTYHRNGTTEPVNRKVVGITQVQRVGSATRTDILVVRSGDTSETKLACDGSIIGLDCTKLRLGDTVVSQDRFFDTGVWGSDTVLIQVIPPTQP